MSTRKPNTHQNARLFLFNRKLDLLKITNLEIHLIPIVMSLRKISTLLRKIKPSLTTLIILSVTIIAVSSFVFPLFWYGWPSNQAELKPYTDFFTGISSPIISLTTFIATVVIAVGLTKIERKNREADKGKEFLPQMVAEQLFFYSYNSTYRVIQIPTEYTYTKKEQGYKSERPDLDNFVINIYNIGLGAAKNLKFQFEYDIEELSKFTKQLYSENISDVPFDIIRRTFTNKSAIQFKYPANWQMPETIYYVGLEDNLKLTHLLNAGVSPHPYQCRVPRLLLAYHALFLYICFKRIDKTQKPSFPPFKLNIVYEDIAGNVRKTVLEIRFETNLFGSWYLSNLVVSQLSDDRM